MPVRSFVFALLAVTVGAVGGSYIPANASHQDDVSIPSDYNRQECMGPTCTFIATWADRDHDGMAIIEAIITMNTFALEFGIENQAGNVTTVLDPGESFTIPIDGTGEIIGHAGRFDDSPPVTFRAGGVLHAETQGIEECGFASDSVAQGAKDAGSAGCTNLNLAANEDILGQWNDTWASSNPDVVCTTRANGVIADCTSTESVSGAVTLILTRTVDALEWQNYDSKGLRVVPVIALHETQKPDPLQLLVGKGVSIQNPFPGSMASSVQVTFGGTAQPECSDTIDNDGDGTVDCEDFGCWADPQDSTTCNPNDPSEQGDPEFDPGGFRETE